LDLKVVFGDTEVFGALRVVVAAPATLVRPRARPITPPAVTPAARIAIERLLM